MKLLAHSPLSDKRFGFAYTVSEYVEGRHPSYDCPLQELEKVAATYGQLHSVTETEPVLGDEIGWNLDQYSSAWNAILEDEGITPDVSRWFSQNRPHKIGDYQLVHGDANSRNTILTPDRGAVLIDLAPVKFSFAPFELVFLLLNYCKESSARRSYFLDVYQEHLGRGFDIFEKHAPFWLAGGLMERVRYRVNAARSFGNEGNRLEAGNRIRSARATMEYLAHLVDRFPDNAADFGEVLDQFRETL